MWVLRGYGTYIPGGLLFRAREHDFIPPLFPAPPGGHERHNPLRGRERDVAWTRGCAAEALPRVKAKDINNPNGVVPMVRTGGM